jgi:anti-anti-sigma factor
MRVKVDDFDKLIVNDIVIEIVNLTRATYKEAGDLKISIINDIENGFNKFVVDLRQCDFIDSTFLGVLVFALKQTAKLGGDIRIVKSDSIVASLMERIGTLKVFNLFDTVEEAMNSYDSENLTNHYIYVPRKYRKLKISQEPN